MARYVIRTPNPDFNGERGVPFKNGTAITEDPAIAEFCRYLGYTVEEEEEKKRKRDR